MRYPSRASIACLLVVWGFSFNTEAAETIGYYSAPGSACQLSIPTTNTGVRPKATGFRNESTSVSNFVICPIAAPVKGGDYDDFYITFESMDGGNHNVTCTGVIGGQNETAPITYVTFTTDILYPEEKWIYWDALFFGQEPGTSIKGSSVSTITCNLPPQVLIHKIGGSYTYAIGN